MKFSSKEIATTAIFVAIVAAMTFIPNLGLVMFTPIAKFNLVLIPILVCAQTTRLRTAVIVSTVFGVFSFLNNLLYPTSVLSFTFQNPLVSVLPRIPIGLTAYLTYNGLSKLFARSDKKFVSKVLPSAISGAVGTITNTALVFAMWLLLYSGRTLSNGGVMGLPFLGAILASNSVIELAISVVLVPALTLGVKRATAKSEDAAAEKVPEVNLTDTENKK